jgi:Bifunctional DNA primase/polymerase, N-terminal
VSAAGLTRADPLLLRSALALAARGWLVFPCIPGGKRPALRGNWQNLATTSTDQIRAWWAEAPYNVGVACGPSGLVVIDLDIPHGEQPGELPSGMVNGTDALAALCAQYGQPYPLPTYAVETPSGGCHLYYAAPDGRVRNSTGRLGQLIDVRAGDGYVIGAGSRIGERAYTARDERTPVPLPPWISDLLGTAPPRQPGRRLACCAACRERRTRWRRSARKPGTSRPAGREPATIRSTAQPSASASSPRPGSSPRWPWPPP